MGLLWEPVYKDFEKLRDKSIATYEHSIRVGDYALKLFKGLAVFIKSGKTDEYLFNLFDNMVRSNTSAESDVYLFKMFDEVEIGKWEYKAYQAALHHDIGKFNAPPKILNKNGGLSRKEFYELWPHPYHGVEMLINSGCEDKDILIGVYLSHERLNESSYFKTEDRRIGLIARIIGVVDSFDSKVDPHVNGQKAKSVEKAAVELIQDDGLDQYIVSKFIDMMGLEAVYK